GAARVGGAARSGGAQRPLPTRAVLPEARARRRSGARLRGVPEAEGHAARRHTMSPLLAPLLALALAPPAPVKRTPAPPPESVHALLLRAHEQAARKDGAGA